jgi:hypothetical protein
MRQLAVMAAPGVRESAAQSAPSAGNALRALWDDPDRRIFAMAMALAVLGAVLIAVL